MVVVLCYHLPAVYVLHQIWMFFMFWYLKKEKKTPCITLHMTGITVWQLESPCACTGDVTHNGVTIALVFVCDCRHININPSWKSQIFTCCSLLHCMVQLECYCECVVCRTKYRHEWHVIELWYCCQHCELSILAECRALSCKKDVKILEYFFFIYRNSKSCMCSYTELSVFYVF